MDRGEGLSQRHQLMGVPELGREEILDVGAARFDGPAGDAPVVPRRNAFNFRVNGHDVTEARRVVERVAQLEVGVDDLPPPLEPDTDLARQHHGGSRYERAIGSWL